MLRYVFACAWCRVVDVLCCLCLCCVLCGGGVCVVLLYCVGVVAVSVCDVFRDWV